MRSKLSSVLAIAALAVAAVGASTLTVTASPMLVADYKAANYNATTGVWTDSSGSGNNATVGAGVTAPTMLANATPNGSSAVHFGGNNSYLAITTGLPTGSGYTVLAFAEPTGTGSTYAVVGGGPGSMEYRIQTLSDGNRQALLNTDTTAFGVSSTSVPTTSFSMIGVATDNSGNATFYLNGSPDGTTTGNTPFTQPIQQVGDAYTGAGATPNEFFVGNIAELQIYSGVLTSSQVQTVDQAFINAYVTPVPEPATLGLVAFGGLGLLLVGRKRLGHRIA